MEKDKNDRRKVKEPFPPHHTPHPPQIMNPDSDKERIEKGSGVKNEQNKKEERKPAQNQEKPEKKKLPGESEIEIDDETTI